MNFGEVLSRAWQIIWKHKVLWIFGILAGCSSAAGSGGSNSGYRFSGRDLSPEVQRFFNQFNQMPGWELALLVGILILIILLLVILFVFLGTIGRIGLIRGTLLAETGAPSLIFSELFNDSLRYFWRVFLLNLLIGLALFAVALILFVLAIGSVVVTLGLILICFLPLLCILVPLVWFIQLVIEQTNVALVVEDVGILEGLRRGWQIVTAHLGEYILMGLILIVGIGIIAVAIIGIPFSVLIVPALAGALIGSQGSLTGGLIIFGLCLVLYLPVLLLLVGILRAYVTSAWTLTYLRLSAKPLPAQPALATS